MLRTWLDSDALDDSFPLPLDTPFTTRTAVAAGVSRHWLTQLHAQRLLRNPLRGVHVAAGVPDTLATRVECLRLVMHEDAVLCDRHAGWLHGAEMVLVPGEHLQLRGLTLDLPGGRGRLRNKLTDGGQRQLRPDDVMEVRGIRVTTPLRTAWDLGRTRWPEPALSGLDAMLRLGAFTSTDLVSGIERFKSMRWVTTLRTYAPLADGRAESPGESALRLRFMENGLPYEPQIAVSSGPRRAWIDVGDRASRFGVEYQGREWHEDALSQARDRTRMDWLERSAGWTMREVWAEDVYGHERAIDRILREGIAFARARHRRPA